MTYALDTDYTPMTIEYQGHTVRRGWGAKGDKFVWGNHWECHGADAEQTSYCPFCAERNGWVWVDPNTMRVGVLGEAMG